jgi:hypothetical protein
MASPIADFQFTAFTRANLVFVNRLCTTTKAYFARLLIWWVHYWVVFFIETYMVKYLNDYHYKHCRDAKSNTSDICTNVLQTITVLRDGKFDKEIVAAVALIMVYCSWDLICYLSNKLWIQVGPRLGFRARTPSIVLHDLEGLLPREVLEAVYQQRLPEFGIGGGQPTPSRAVLAQNAARVTGRARFVAAHGDAEEATAEAAARREEAAEVARAADAAEPIAGAQAEAAAAAPDAAETSVQGAIRRSPRFAVGVTPAQIRF